MLLHCYSVFCFDTKFSNIMPIIKYGELKFVYKTNNLLEKWKN
jgi:hypothetical protein